MTLPALLILILLVSLGQDALVPYNWTTGSVLAASGAILMLMTRRL